MKENKLIDAIIYCMENQNTQFYFNSKNQDISETEQANYIPLPVWSSFDGFQTMENFTAALKNPLHKKALAKVLENGKGVFRNFKDTLKKFPGLEEKYKEYKYKTIKNRVLAFLDSLKINKSLYLTNEENQYEINLEDFDVIISDYSEDIILSCDYCEYLSQFNIKGNRDYKVAIIKSCNNNVANIKYFKENDTVIIVYYYVNKDFRDLGLFKLGFNKIIENESCKEVVLADVNKEQILTHMLENLDGERVYTEYRIKI